MRLKLLRVWGHTERPWGYDVRVDYRDVETGVLRLVELTFREKPDAKTLGAAVEARRALEESRLAAERAEAAADAAQRSDESSEVSALKAENDALRAEIKALKDKG